MWWFVVAGVFGIVGVLGIMFYPDDLSSEGEW